MQDALVAQAGLPVPAVVPQQQHVGQVRDVAGGQAQRLYLRELPVGGLGGNERAERCECRVHTVRPVPFPRVGRLPLLAHAGETRVSTVSSTTAASPPSPPSGRTGPVTRCPLIRPIRVYAGAAAAGGLPIRAVAVAAAVQVVQVGGEAVGLRGVLPACGPHLGSALVGLELLGVVRAGGGCTSLYRGGENSTRGAKQLPPIR